MLRPGSLSNGAWRRPSQPVKTGTKLRIDAGGGRVREVDAAVSLHIFGNSDADAHGSRTLGTLGGGETSAALFTTLPPEHCTVTNEMSSQPLDAEIVAEPVAQAHTD